MKSSKPNTIFSPAWHKRQSRALKIEDGFLMERCQTIYSDKFFPLPEIGIGPPTSHIGQALVTVRSRSVCFVGLNRLNVQVFGG